MRWQAGYFKMSTVAWSSLPVCHGEFLVVASALRLFAEAVGPVWKLYVRGYSVADGSDLSEKVGIPAIKLDKTHEACRCWSRGAKAVCVAVREVVDDVFPIHQVR
ncbi:MAG: hypothetical protein M2R45_02245 [Verrucomicrobia subdivision 3 bacterium]|nr:hypothetical protein [Limisphaerales bacterium]MCS1413969.1 hypothetical protein [Limisphaerales bacterium]